jgi:hypothetical protein
VGLKKILRSVSQYKSHCIRTLSIEEVAQCVQAPQLAISKAKADRVGMGCFRE